MEGIGGELINADNKTVNELKGELAAAYKTIAELQKKIALLEVRHLQSEADADDRVPEVKLEMVERKAEEIIPKECWEIVFRNLNAEDLLNCRQVCKIFNQLMDLKEFKEQWKFKLILPQLFPYLKTSDWDPWKHLYNPRLVCQSWRHWIGKYASESKSFAPSNLPLRTSFETSEDIQEFLEQFGECTTNPFPSSSVEIKKPYELDEKVEDGDWLGAMQQLHDTYFGNVGQLLEQFGKHIFRLRLYFGYPSDPCLMNLCSLIKSITIHLPNLKELDIDCPCYVDSYIEEEEEEEDKEMQMMAENPLEASTLPKLRVLSISCLNFEKKIDDYLLLAFAPQLTHLKTHFPPNSQMQQFKNLRELSLDVDKPRETLESLRFLQSPLEELKLNCTFGTSCRTWNVDKVLRNLKHLPIELLEIRLRIWDEGRVNLAESGLDNEEYNNASIKTLTIEIGGHDSDGHQISFNFLQALTKLENLQLKFETRHPPHLITHPQELRDVVKLNEYLFVEGETDMIYHSNVWEKVPNLKTITSVVHTWYPRLTNKSIFTREKYEGIRIIVEGDVPE